ncbi:hypothetical protein EDD86DRAFT_233153 [Gorgonomyces haynaldii]|nr:hypothetical protein EDD86DRAFT_233153 [Gorgonomyces haynaldii]
MKAVSVSSAPVMDVRYEVKSKCVYSRLQAAVFNRLRPGSKQISDIHVSKFATKTGLVFLKRFLDVELPLIAPDLVFATGDLTDAKYPHTLTSKQHKEEWIEYHLALQQSHVLERPDFYWDLRGNHDCFNVPMYNHPENRFKDYSATKKQGYQVTLKKDFGTYGFIALDACPETGASKPLNFFGYLDRVDMNFFRDKMEDMIFHNHSFGMTHYPTGYMLFGKSSDGLGFWDMAPHLSLWLSGHLHKLAGGLGEEMYAFQRKRLLELELGDMKKHGMIRIVAVDNDLVSFKDVPIALDKAISPIVLITNPKDARFLLKSKEPLYLMKQSHEIRVLVWSTEKPQIQCFIDNQEIKSPVVYKGIGKSWTSIGLEPTHVPLYTLEWNPSLYSDGPHTILCLAQDRHLSGNHTFTFRLDERLEDMNAGTGGFIISLQMGYLVFYIILVQRVLSSLSFVMLTRASEKYQPWKEATSKELVQRDVAALHYLQQSHPTLRQRWEHLHSDFIFTMKAYFLRLCEVANDASIFYPIYGYMMYISVFPWFLADFVPSSEDPDRRYGFLYVYGIRMLEVFPLLFFLCFITTSPHLFYSPKNDRYAHPIHNRWYVWTVVVLVCIYHLMDCLTLGLFYGPYATWISPGKTWFALWATFVLYTKRNGPTDAFFDKDRTLDPVKKKS